MVTSPRTPNGVAVDTADRCALVGIDLRNLAPEFVETHSVRGDVVAPSVHPLRMISCTMAFINAVLVPGRGAGGLRDGGVAGIDANECPEEPHRRGGPGIHSTSLCLGHVVPE
jgi:hypothetical protein